MSEHYFSPRPGAPHRPGLVRVVLPDVYLELATDAGVFSPGRLDPGTRLLLDSRAAATRSRIFTTPGRTSRDEDRYSQACRNSSFGESCSISRANRNSSSSFQRGPSTVRHPRYPAISRR